MAQATTEAPAVQANGAQPEPEQPAANVWQAWHRVLRDMPGIQKLTSEQHKARSGGRADAGERGVSYAYRSIDQVLAETQQLFARHGIVLVPQVVGRAEPRVFTMGQSSTRWTDEELQVLYWVVGPGGAERRQELVDNQLVWWLDGDCFSAGPFTGQGRDNSDKGINKAMTQAEKQALLQLLQIGDPKDDGDHERHLDEGGRAATPQQAPAQPWWLVQGFQSEEVARQQIDALREAIGALDEAGRQAVAQQLTDWGHVAPADAPPEHAGKPRLASITAEHAVGLAEQVRLLLQAAGQQAATAPVAAPAAPEQPAAPDQPPAAPEAPQAPTAPEPAAEPEASAAEGRPRRPRTPR